MLPRRPRPSGGRRRRRFSQDRLSFRALWVLPALPAALQFGGLEEGGKGPEPALSYIPFLTAAFSVPSPLRLPPPRSRVAPEAQDASLLRCRPSKSGHRPCLRPPRARRSDPAMTPWNARRGRRARESEEEGAARPARTPGATGNRPEPRPQLPSSFSLMRSWKRPARVQPSAALGPRAHTVRAGSVYPLPLPPGRNPSWTVCSRSVRRGVTQGETFGGLSTLPHLALGLR